MSARISVSGGSGGIVAQCDAIRTLAAQFGAAATETLGSTWTLHRYLVRPAVMSSGLLDPAGLAAFEADLVDALDGPQGLSWVAARCGLLDGELRAAATGYQLADELAGRLHDEVLGLLGTPSAIVAGTEAALGGAGPGTATQHALTTDPGLADLLIDSLGLQTVIAGAATVLPDGHGVAHSLGTDMSPIGSTPPRTLKDIFEDVSDRTDDPRHGAIDVRILTMADGTRRVIVDVTGTKSWTPLPTDDVTSLETNGRSISGESSAYEQGVLAAMRQAGVRHTDPVLIVGHSEGGMVAVTTARDAVRSGDFDVTHVITAGSPIGRTVGGLPSSVQVLALENERDLVPHLDGVENPDRPNVTTVRGSFGDGTVQDDHSLPDAYIPLAAAVDAGRATSLRTFRQGLQPYLRAVAVRTHSFQIVRRYR